jgi:hypothetical protein
MIKQLLAAPKRPCWIVAPVRNSGMKHVNLWSVYYIGYSLNALTSAEFKRARNWLEAWHCLHEAKFGLELLEQGDPFQFSQRTRAAISKLAALVNEALDMPKDDLTAYSQVSAKLAKTDDPDPAFHLLFAIMEGVKKVEVMLAHEMPELSVFFVQQKGTHRTDLLLDNAADNLGKDVAARLSADAKANVNASGRCLALDSPTASAFHMLRAVESLMRDYHFKLTGQHLPVKSRNWGAFIKVLNNNGADQKVTGYLTHIKDFYRNPIVHPEESFNGDEAFSLFGASLSAITMLDAAIHPPKP